MCDRFGGIILPSSGFKHFASDQLLFILFCFVDSSLLSSSAELTDEAMSRMCTYSGYVTYNIYTTT